MADFSLTTLFQYTENEYISGLQRIISDQAVIYQEAIVAEFQKQYPNYKKDERGKEFQAALWLADTEIHLRYDEISLYRGLFGTKKPLKRIVHQLIAAVMSGPARLAVEEQDGSGGE
jgi:hypothetical protein